MSVLAPEENEVVLVTIPNIELLSVGEWNASTGLAVFTPEDLQAIIAAVDDPAIHAPRLRIELTGPGPHTGPDVGPEESAGGFGEQPCFGRFVNLRLNDTGTTIIADAAGVPAWLAEVLPSAYPSRSVEAYRNYTTTSGRTHACVITSVALLSVSMPACETLEDLRLAYGAEIPDGVEFTFGERITATRGEPMPAKRVSASVTYTDVRRSFYEEVAAGDRYWWWICDFIMSPPTVIVDDDEGGLWSIPYTLSGETVDWGEPVEVRVQYVEKESGKVAASKPADSDIAAYTTEYVTASTRFAMPETPAFTAAESRPSDRVRAANVQEGASMNDEQKKLAEKHGLSADATVEELNAKLQADAIAALEADEQETETTEEETETPTALQVAPDALAQLQEDARLGREARQQQLQAEREQIVDGRIEAGAITPASRAAHLAELNKGGEIEKTHRDYLAGLASGVIPVKERGVNPDSQNGDGGRVPLDQVMASFGTRSARAGKEKA